MDKKCELLKKAEKQVELTQKQPAEKGKILPEQEKLKRKQKTKK
jgi:hypothetical protein